METTAALRCQTRHYRSSLSPLPVNFHHYFSRRTHRPHQNVEKFSMSLRDLTLRRITTPQYLFRFNHPTKVFCIANDFTSIQHDIMAEESKSKDGNVDQISKSKEEKEKGPEKSTPAIPPPPEKPLPGDCCDSGCVRCVWDVYYEELEEYNRLYKADSKTS
ncbi:hypothetical protein CDL12_10726 [Handroanthus impetiginosus]|uniref:Oxidoreductase-like domain-containing protein n=1 Tax=Handroanthus impetiginosus TaxID=429701 RepID=A0A2G9HGJ4_9LAMI|nr:hypothetical protein CDL12_10726 [Handroanthus impetiginosus]